MCMNPCPLCGGESLLLNLYKEHWVVCEPCRVKWPVGWNLFSCWQEETEDTWNRNAEILKGYTLVVSDYEQRPRDSWHVPPRGNMVMYGADGQVIFAHGQRPCDDLPF